MTKHIVIIYKYRKNVKQLSFSHFSPFFMQKSLILICDADIEVLPRSKSNCSGALFYYLSAQIKQNSVFYANFQNRIINRFFGQAFSRKKSLRVEGGALVALRRERNPHTSCAPQGVNSKTVRWTVLEEGTPCKRGRAPLKHNFTILLY